MRVLRPRRAVVAISLAIAAAGVSSQGVAQGDDSACDPFESVRELNSAPLAADDSAWVAPGEVVRIAVLENDIDFDDDALTIDTVTEPTSGSATIEETDIAFIAPDAEGPVTFQYRVSDDACGTDVATVRVTVAREEQPEDMAEPAAPSESIPDFAG